MAVFGNPQRREFPGEQTVRFLLWRYSKYWEHLRKPVFCSCSILFTQSTMCMLINCCFVMSGAFFYQSCLIGMQLQSPRTAIGDKGVAWPSWRQQKESQAYSAHITEHHFILLHNCCWRRQAICPGCRSSLPSRSTTRLVASSCFVYTPSVSWNTSSMAFHCRFPF
jgi:hypothetical protein